LNRGIEDYRLFRFESGFGFAGKFGGHPCFLYEDKILLIHKREKQKNKN